MSNLSPLPEVKRKLDFGAVISRIRLSDKTSRFRVQRPLQLLNIYWS
jgi:hypothetical protein